ncbi:uncharacterized protein LOC120354748 isoform X2 [Nilaparvata lugens]|uniref:uncharacterized protein LOC120354748 isoform X2 n=2 Tax=Nilaparvata lugens TaxID=108931 RepID=UPI00193D619F|nr:uncharacterized protein LOC120354748 isoform X2 [Nilaparvata lugens]
MHQSSVEMGNPFSTGRGPQPSGERSEPPLRGRPRCKYKNRFSSETYLQACLAGWFLLPHLGGTLGLRPVFSAPPPTGDEQGPVQTCFSLEGHINTNPGQNKKKNHEATKVPQRLMAKWQASMDAAMRLMMHQSDLLDLPDDGNW